MKLAIVIINWRSELLTLECIRGLKSWKRLKPQIIVVDNESTPQSKQAFLSELKSRNILENKINLGYTGASNQGIAHALQNGANFVLLLNTDAKVDENCIEHLLQSIANNGKIGVIGPVLKERFRGQNSYMIGGRNIAEHRHTRTVLSPEQFDNRTFRDSIDVDYVPGTVCLISRPALEKTGELDEQYFFSGEIADFCRRAQDAGFQNCIATGVTATHDVTKTSSSIRQTIYTYYNFRNRFLFIQKHENHRKLWFYSIWIVRGLVDIAKSVASGKFHQARAIAMGGFDGIAGRFGNQNDRLN